MLSGVDRREREEKWVKSKNEFLPKTRPQVTAEAMIVFQLTFDLRESVLIKHVTHR